MRKKRKEKREARTVFFSCVICKRVRLTTLPPAGHGSTPPRGLSFPYTPSHLPPTIYYRRASYVRTTRFLSSLQFFECSVDARAYKNYCNYSPTTPTQKCILALRSTDYGCCTAVMRAVLFVAPLALQMVLRRRGEDLVMTSTLLPPPSSLSRMAN